MPRIGAKYIEPQTVSQQESDGKLVQFLVDLDLYPHRDPFASLHGAHLGAVLQLPERIVRLRP